MVSRIGDLRVAKNRAWQRQSVRQSEGTEDPAAAASLVMAAQHR